MFGGVTKRHNPKLGVLIRELRTGFAEDQEHFAKRIGVTRETLSRYENGLRPKPNVLTTLFHLAAQIGPAIAADLWVEMNGGGERPSNPPSAAIAVPSSQLDELKTIVDELRAEWGKISLRIEQADTDHLVPHAYKVERRMGELTNWVFRWVR
jgi:DNA-binding XRE family transcriptional regulator